MQLITRLKLEAFDKEVIPKLKDNFLNKPTGNYTPRKQREQMASSVRSEFSDTTYTLYADAYAFTYEYGRGPTINPGTGAVRRNVLQYLTEENIQPKGQKRNGMPAELEDLAFWISRGIHEEGSRLFREKRQSGVISEVINSDSLDKLQASIAEALLVDTSTFLLNGIETK
jgi:hypothetical protein